MSSKRKRYTGTSQGVHPSGGGGGGGGGGGDADLDYGNQTLPVAVLPADFDGVPLDGATYLAMVRKEASTHPSIYLAPSNPYAIAPSTSLPPTTTSTSSSTLPPSLPTQPWRSTSLTHFLALREALLNPPASPRPRPPGRISKPRTNDTGHRSWFRFVWGRERPVDSEGRVVVGVRAAGVSDVEEEDGDEEEEGGEEEEEGDAMRQNGTAPTPMQPHSHPPRLPTPTLLARFTPPQVLALLEVIPYWMTIPSELLPSPNVSEGEVGASNGDGEGEGAPPQALHPHLALWTFSLLARLDARLSSDEISILRVLARAVIAAIGLHRRRRGVRVAEALAEAAAGPGPGAAESEASAWLIVGIVAGAWGQSDLWEDAEGEMRAVAVEVEAEVGEMEGVR